MDESGDSGMVSTDLDYIIGAQKLTPLASDEEPIQVQIHEADGIYIRQMRMLRADTLIEQHVHPWTHLTMVARGAVYLWRDGKYAGKYDAPTAVRIEAGVAHSFLTAEPGTVLYCIHSLSHGEALKAMVEHGLTEE